MRVPGRPWYNSPRPWRRRDYSRAFEADYSLSAFVVAYFDLYKLGQGLQIQAFDPAASEADYSRAFFKPFRNRRCKMIIHIVIRIAHHTAANSNPIHEFFWRSKH